MKTFILLLALIVAVPSLVFATKIKDIEVSPKNPKVGDVVRISVKTSGDVGRAVIEFPDLNVKKELTAIGKNTWGIAIPLNTTGEKKFKVLLYHKKNDKNPKDTEKERFSVSATNDVARPHPYPVPGKPQPVPVEPVAPQQYGSLSGRVHRNSASGPALAGVSVTCGGRNSTTDGNGYFKVDGIQAGTHEISLSKYGYDEFRKAITVKAKMNTSIDDRWLTEKSTGAQLPNVNSVNVNPASITAGQSALFTATTDSAASKVILRFTDAGIDVNMSGNGTTWKVNPQINNAGNRPFTVTAYDNSNKHGSERKGTILVKKTTESNHQNSVSSNLRHDFSLPYYRDYNPFWTSGYAPREVAPPGPKLGDAKGNCTWYANGRLRELGYSIPNDCFRHNAKTWVADAKKKGFIVDKTPQVGSIAQSDTMNLKYGHVAVVEAVYSDGKILISESSYAPGNKDWDFLYNTRIVDRSIFTNYIHAPRQ